MDRLYHSSLDLCLHITILGGMATQPIDTAKLYTLTSAGSCSVTLTQGENSITWVALAEGGQTSFIVPAGATVEISDSTALLSPLPANFKAALGAGNGRIGGMTMPGETITPHTSTTPELELPMQHNTWHTTSGTEEHILLTPSVDNGRALSMQLMLTPATHMAEGWLTVPVGVNLVWLYGEPTILSGHTYIIGVTQIAPDKILANLLATF